MKQSATYLLICKIRHVIEADFCLQLPQVLLEILKKFSQLSCQALAVEWIVFVAPRSASVPYDLACLAVEDQREHAIDVGFGLFREVNAVVYYEIRYLHADFNSLFQSLLVCIFGIAYIRDQQAVTTTALANRVAYFIGNNQMLSSTCRKID